MKRILNFIALIVALCASAFGSYNGTVVGTPSYTAGVFGSAMTNFNTGSGVNLPVAMSNAMAAGNSCTIEYRYKITGTGIYVAIGMANNSTYLAIANGNLVADNGFVAVNASVANVADGAWHHVAHVINAGTGQVYFDGVAVGGTTSGRSCSSIMSGNAAYIGIYPPAAGFYFNGGSVDEVAFWNSAKYTSNFTPPSSPYLGSESGLVALFHLDGAATDSSTGGVISIAPNNAAFVYSPYNWTLNSASATTINSGAYFRVMFSGTFVSMNFDTTGNTSIPTIMARIDNGPWTSSGVSSPVGFSGLSARTHLLEFVVRDAITFSGRWSVQGGVKFTGLSIGAGQTVSSPSRKTKNILIYGDSITEGYNAHGSSQNDATSCYSYALYEAADAEVGIVALSGVGAVTALSGVPALTGSYNFVYSGAARAFSPAPDLVVYNYGTNDGINNISSAMVTVATGILAAAPNSKHLLLVPFNGTHAADISAAVSSIGSSATFGDTTGWWSSADSADGLHPYDYWQRGIGPERLLPIVTSILYPNGRGATAGFITAQ